MLAKGLKAGDEALEYGVFSQAERGQSDKGLADTLEKAGLKVDRVDISQEVNSDTSLGIPLLVAYVQAHPNLKAIGTQHGGVTGILAEVLKRQARNPAKSSSAVLTWRRDDRWVEVRLRLGDARSAPLSAGLHAGPAVRADGEVQDAGPFDEYGCRYGHAGHHRRAHEADRRRHPLSRPPNAKCTPAADLPACSPNTARDGAHFSRRVGLSCTARVRGQTSSSQNISCLAHARPGRQGPTPWAAPGFAGSPCRATR